MVLLREAELIAKIAGNLVAAGWPAEPAVKEATKILRLSQEAFPGA